MTEKTINWDGGIWTKSAIESEILSLRKNLEMALSEAEAGQKRMIGFAEGWASRLDSLNWLLQRINLQQQ